MGRRTILTITTPLHRCLRRSDRQDRWRGARAMGSIRSEPAKPPAIWGMSVEMPRPPFGALLSAEALLDDGTTRAVPLGDLLTVGVEPALVTLRQGASLPSNTVE